MPKATEVALLIMSKFISSCPENPSVSVPIATSGRCDPVDRCLWEPPSAAESLSWYNGMPR